MGVVFIFLLAVPIVVSAQDTSVVLATVAVFIRTTLGILFFLAALWVLWGVLRLMFAKKDFAGRAHARDVITRGIIGMVIMAASWGVVTIIVRIFVPMQL